MNNLYNNKHLSLEDRIKIEEGIVKGLRKFQIANSINKSPSTVAKEIKRNRKLKPRNSFNDNINRCIHLNYCKVCYNKCKDYKEEPCFRRDRFVGACNNCPSLSKCKLNKPPRGKPRGILSSLNTNKHEKLETIDIMWYT